RRHVGITSHHALGVDAEPESRSEVNQAAGTGEDYAGASWLEVRAVAGDLPRDIDCIGGTQTIARQHAEIGWSTRAADESVLGAHAGRQNARDLAGGVDGVAGESRAADRREWRHRIERRGGSRGRQS